MWGASIDENAYVVAVYIFVYKKGAMRELWQGAPSLRFLLTRPALPKGANICSLDILLHP